MSMKGFSYFQSSDNHCVYHFLYTKQENEPLPQLMMHRHPHQLIKKHETVITAMFENEPIMTLKMPFSAILLSLPEIPQNSSSLEQIQLFSVRVCQHCPISILQNSQVRRLNSPKDLSNPLIRTRQICGLCEEPLWYYFSPIQHQITLSEFHHFYEDLDLTKMKWNVVLNEYFTMNTQIASCQGKSFCFKFSGKISFLQNLHNLEFQTKIPDIAILLKVKKVVCSHERILNQTCQFCLCNLSQNQLQKSKKFLFQLENDHNNHENLQEEQRTFVENILNSQKAILILDLDNTILHSVQLLKIPHQLLAQIEDYMLSTDMQPLSTKMQKTVTKFRPYFENFLEQIINLYQIYIYTKGKRVYAEWICQGIRQKYKKLLQHSKNFTSTRILSRDEDPILHKKFITHIMPNIIQPVLILDDRRDVWNHSSHCLYTKEFYYFFMIYRTLPSVKIQPIQWKKENQITDSTAEKPKQQVLEVEITLNHQQRDNFLLFAASTLKTIHKMFFQQFEKGSNSMPDMKNLLNEHRKSILKGMKAILLLPNPKSTLIYKRAISLGMTILENCSEGQPDIGTISSIIVIRVNDLEKTIKSRSISSCFHFSKQLFKKLKHYSQIMQLPIISENWINLCYEYTYAFPYKLFEAENACSTVVLSEDRNVEVCTQTLESEVNQLLK